MLTLVERDGVVIHLFNDAAQANSPVGVHIFTAELDELAAELEARGAKASRHRVGSICKQETLD